MAGRKLHFHYTSFVYPLAFLSSAFFLQMKNAEEEKIQALEPDMSKFESLFCHLFVYSLGQVTVLSLSLSIPNKG